MPAVPAVPALPGRLLTVDARGTPAAVRQIDGPEQSPVLLLLHGWGATSDVTWRSCYSVLREQFGVLAMDLPGHGGSAAAGRFSLEGCADDAASVVGQLRGGQPVIVVGYSMGGAVAQLLAERHPESVAGLVLCATAARFFPPTPAVTCRRIAIRSLESLLRQVPPPARSRLFAHQVRRIARVRRRPLDGWSYSQICSGDAAAVAGAAAALRSFDSRPWLARAAVPTSIVAATCDTVVPCSAQRQLSSLLPDAPVGWVEGGHDVCVTAPELFAEVLLKACLGVAAPRTPSKR